MTQHRANTAEEGFQRYIRLLKLSLFCAAAAGLVSAHGAGWGMDLTAEMYQADPAADESWDYHAPGMGMLWLFFGSLFIGVPVIIAYAVVAVGLILRREWGVFMGAAGAVVGSLSMVFGLGSLVVSNAGTVVTLFASDYTPSGSYWLLAGTLLSAAGVVAHCVISVLWLRAMASRPVR